MKDLQSNVLKFNEINSKICHPHDSTKYLDTDISMERNKKGNRMHGKRGREHGHMG